MPSKTALSCWIVTEGIAGTENQCLGLAAALGVAAEVKRIRLLLPWLPGRLNAFLHPGGAALCPPWPDLLIASGRKSLGAALRVKRKSGGKTFVVQVQDPRIAPENFDLVAVPQHDPARGENVVVTTGALHGVTPAVLDAARRDWAVRLSFLPAPRVAVLIGGSSRAHRMTRAAAERLAAQLRALAAAGHGLMVTASRRTGAKNMELLRGVLAGEKNVFFWDGTGDSPYTGFLALADYIIVTEDSVSMTSEALATGKPVHVAPLEGGARRLAQFHRLLREQGYTRPFSGALENWTYDPPQDTRRVAEAIEKRMKN